MTRTVLTNPKGTTMRIITRICAAVAAVALVATMSAAPTHADPEPPESGPCTWDPETGVGSCSLPCGQLQRQVYELQHIAEVKRYRIADLRVRVADKDQRIDTLSNKVERKADRIDRLWERIQRLRDRVR